MTMKKDSIHRPALSFLAACVAALLCGTAAANPTGGIAANGTVTIATSGNTLTVTNSPNSIINWQGFSISAGELTNFVQQSVSSAVLNRVVGINPSSILGTLQSNGRVFLVNPNGIVFGAGSQVNVGGLIATTLNITDANFVAGVHNYTAGVTAGAITVDGAIAAQNGVYLIAPNITISGSVTSTQGSLVFAAGQTASIVESGVGNASSVVVTGNGTEIISTTGTGTFSAPNSFFQVATGGSGIGNIIPPLPIPTPLPVLTGPVTIFGGGTTTGNLNISGGSAIGTLTASSANVGGTISGGGAITLSTGNIGIGASGGALSGVGTFAVTGAGSGSQSPQFVFGDTSSVKVAETRDVAGNITGWSLAAK